tara:strand:- start:6286 stop:15834 length:9549 start_codon:yes stop_codon:yes gene_type:complete
MIKIYILNNNMVYISAINTGTRLTTPLEVKGNLNTFGNVNIGGTINVDYWSLYKEFNVFGNANIHGNLNLYGAPVRLINTKDSDSLATGGLIINGGVAIQKNLNMGGTFKNYNSVDAGGLNTGSFILSGGASIAKNLTIGGNLAFGGELTAPIDPLTIKSNLAISSKGFILLPKGTTAERVTTSQDGMMRYNTEYKTFEGYSNSTWGSLGGTIDTDRDTKILVEEKIDEDIIRFYTQGNQRMIMSNNSKSGNIGIGLGFNQPTGTLDIKGNLNISSNVNIGTTIKLGSTSGVAGETGMIRYNPTTSTFEGYANAKWDSLIGVIDKDRDTKILVENAADEDMIRFYSQGKQRMIIGNNNTNGNIGIGTDFNKPTSTLDIKGNVNIESNLSIGTTLKLKSNYDLNGLNGMIKYDGNEFKGYTKNKWYSLLNRSELLTGSVNYPDNSDLFEVASTSTTYKFATRIIGSFDSNENIFGGSYLHKYQTFTELVTFNKLELLVDSLNITVQRVFTIQIFFNDIAQNLNNTSTELTITVAANYAYSQIIDLPKHLRLLKGNNISIKLKSDTNGTNSKVLVKLLGIKDSQNIQIDGNFAGLYNANATFKYNITAMKNLNVYSNLNVFGSVRIGNVADSDGTNGTIKYDGTTFRGYAQNKWLSLVNTSDVFTAIIGLPFETDSFQINKISNIYKFGNRILGLNDPSDGIQMKYYSMKYQYIEDEVTFKYFEIITDSLHQTKSKRIFIKVFINNVVQELNTGITELSVLLPSGLYSHKVNIPKHFKCLKDSNISIQIKTDLTGNNSILNSELLVKIKGTRKDSYIELNGNMNSVFNTNAIYKYDFSCAGNATFAKSLKLGNIPDNQGKQGMLRYNDTKKTFEGYAASGWFDLATLSDKNVDSYITVEQGLNDDTIRFYSQGKQRVMISNSSRSGNVGIGTGFNKPTATLDIFGNLNVSSNVNFGSTIKLGNGTTTTGEEGMMRYNPTLKIFEGYHKNSWGSLGGSIDKDRDTRIGVENAVDEDMIRFFSQGSQRMIISNASNGGNIGIGNEFNKPTATLDIFGNLSVSSNVNFGSTIKLGNGTNTVGQEGMMRYNPTLKVFEGYQNSSWGSLGGSIDKDRDTKITVENATDEDIIRFYTEGKQRMIMSNNAKSGFIGIGTNFNKPTATLDIIGNVNIKSNLNVGDNIKLGIKNNLVGEAGMLIYNGTEFKGYSNNKWVSLVNPPDVLSSTIGFPQESDIFQIISVDTTYKYANRITGVQDSSDNIFSNSYLHKYQKYNIKVTFKQFEILVDSTDTSIAREYTLKIFVNDVAQVINNGSTELAINYEANMVYSKIINLSTHVIIPTGHNVSVQLKSNNVSKYSNVLVKLIGIRQVESLSINGNFSAIYNTSGTFKQNLNVLGNGLFGGGIKIGGVLTSQGTDGMIRYNKQLKSFEGYSNSNWGSLGGTIDIDRDTKVVVENTADEDMIRLYTQGTQRMVIMNNSKSGNIGIGNNFNMPTSTVDIKGNVSISENASIGGTLKLKDINISAGENGMLKYTNGDFQGFLNNKWVSLVNKADLLTATIEIPNSTDLFQIINTTTDYKTGDRILTSIDPNENILGDGLQYNYQQFTTDVIFSNIEVLTASHTSNKTYTIQILKNNIAQILSGTSTEFTFTINANSTYSQLIQLPQTLKIYKNNNISVKIKSAANSVSSNIIVKLIGNNSLSKLTLDGNFSGMYNTTGTFKHNINILGNGNFKGGINIGTVLNAHGKEGMIRYNKLYKTFEGYSNSSWGSLGGAIDTDRDTKILVESVTDEDIIRFYTQGKQRMIISNSSKSGNLGIGTGFNKPTATVDIFGNLSISQNVNIGSTLKFKAFNSTSGENGMIKYNNNRLQLYTTKWENIDKTVDINNDTKIVIDETLNNDIINLYTQGEKRMIISNKTTSGFIGIGTNFNKPTASLDVFGNFNVSSNANFGSTIKIGNSVNNNGQDGMIRYNSSKKIFEGYSNSSWVNLGSTIDSDRDTKIIVDNVLDEDIIRFYTEGSQRMIISNNSKSGNIGIGFNNNNPSATLDIKGNVNITSNLNIGKTINLKTNSETYGESGMIKYDGNEFKGYTNNKWVTFVNPPDTFATTVGLTQDSDVFEISSVSQTYKFLNRILGKEDVDDNIFTANYIHKYQIFPLDTIFNKVEILIDSLNKTVARTFTIQISVNNIMKQELSCVYAANESYAKLITIPNNLSVLANQNVSIAIKSDTNGVNSRGIIKLIGNKKQQTLSLSGNLSAVYNANAQYKYNVSVLQNGIFGGSITIGSILDADGKNGMIRYNPTLKIFEGYQNNNWIPFGSLTDKNKDTFIKVEQGSNDDTIRLYTQGSQRMMVSNSSRSGYTGVGTGFNKPTATLDVFGNFNVSSNVNFGSTIKLGSGTNAVGQEGMMRYNPTLKVFEGYQNSSWGSLGGSIDKDRDTKITVENATDEDKIRFYTHGTQRMMIENNTKSGYIGIGTNFNKPTATLDIAGNLNISSNVNINKTLKLNNNLDSYGEDGMLKYTNNKFQGFYKSKWRNINEVADIDNDTKIEIDKTDNDNIIRVFTHGKQRMMVGNNTKSGNIGFGFNNNNPKGTVDILGNLNISSNVNVGTTLKLLNYTGAYGEAGMLSYDGAEFKAYTKNKWIPFVSTSETLSATVTLPQESDLFEVVDTDIIYKYANRTTGVQDEANNVLTQTYFYMYQRFTEKVTFNKVEIIVDSLNNAVARQFTLQILVNNVAKSINNTSTEFNINVNANVIDSQIITLPTAVIVNMNENVSIKLKSNAASKNSSVLLKLLGEKDRSNLTIDGNFGGLYNTNATFKYNIAALQNLNVYSNLNVYGSVRIGNVADSDGTNGTIKYDGTTFRGYAQNKWLSLVNTSDVFTAISSLPFSTETFQVNKISAIYKNGNRVLGLNDPSDGIQMKYYNIQYQYIEDEIYINKIEINLDSLHIAKTKHIYIKILVNDVEQVLTGNNKEYLLVIPANLNGKVFDIPTKVTIPKNSNVSIKLKTLNSGVNSILNSEVLLRLIGNRKESYLELNGNFNAVYNTNATFKHNITTLQNINVSDSVYISKTLTKGSGSFDIPHVLEDKKNEGWRLRHYFVETPSSGGNIYKYQKQCIKGENVFDLPDWFNQLNRDVIVYVVPFKHFGCGWGEVNENNKCVVNVNKKGKYNILVFGDRKDPIALENYNTYGIEYKM